MNDKDYCKTLNYIDAPGNVVSHFQLNLKDAMINTGTWVLIFTNFVPISLLVGLETVCFIQGLMISDDKKLI